MLGNLDFWHQQIKYKDHVLFVQCSEESSNRDIFEKYNIKAIPTFMFIKNNEQVEKPVAGHGIRRFDIETIMNRLLNGKT
jgi:thioredoxin-related protein